MGGRGYEDARHEQEHTEKGFKKAFTCLPLYPNTSHVFIGYASNSALQSSLTRPAMLDTLSIALLRARTSFMSLALRAPGARVSIDSSQNVRRRIDPQQHRETRLVDAPEAEMLARLRRRVFATGPPDPPLVMTHVSKHSFHVQRVQTAHEVGHGVKHLY